MRVIDIKNLIELYDEPFLMQNVEILKENKISPSLAVVKTSDDEGARSYIKGIEKICKRYDINFYPYHATNQENLEVIINEINTEKNIDASLILYPTPFEKADREFMNQIVEEKDVEGLHNTNLGYLVQFKKSHDPFGLRKLVIPPTSKGILYVLKRYDLLYEKYFTKNGTYPENYRENPFKLLGKKVSIINDSLSVGKSLALMLMNANSSVRVCQKFTDIQDIYQFTKLSDIIISAVPVKGWKIPTEFIPPNSIIFDIAFEGNFEYPEIYDKCYCITPRWDETEKGNRINDMTLTRLISNTLYLSNKKLPDKILKHIYEVQKVVLEKAIDKHLEILSES